MVLFLSPDEYQTLCLRANFSLFSFETQRTEKERKKKDAKDDAKSRNTSDIPGSTLEPGL